ncbi:unnamed protein product, partial [Coregonus sp. 'balchen']
MEGRLLEGSDVKMSCKSTDGSDPINYKWERLLDKGKYVGKLPPLALIDVRGMGVVAGAVVGVSFGVLLIILIIWLVEDAEAPKAKLVKPNSLSSSRSGSSRSGTSSTQSMVHTTAPRGPRARLPDVAALNENGQPTSFPQQPPAYTQVVPKTPEPRTAPAKPSPPPKLSPGNLARMGATPVMIPAQTKAFQTV